MKDICEAIDRVAATTARQTGLKELMACPKCGGTIHGDACKLCDMFESQRAPFAVSDNLFCEGHCNGSQFAGRPQDGDQYAKVAKRHGVSTKGKIYLRSLAAFPGDPEAWVSGRGDVKRVLEQRNWSAEGTVNHKADNSIVKEAPSVGVAPDILNREVGKIVDANPGIAETPREKADLTEKVHKQLKPHWAK